MSVEAINFSETRRLATQMVVTGEKILSLLEIRRPVSAPQAGLDSGLKLAVIRSIVAAHYGFTSAELIKQDRHAAVAWARQVAMFLCREMTTCRSLQIEKDFKRSHNTLPNALKQVYNRCSVETKDGLRCRADLINLRAQIMEALK